jgi:hypothetical protein
MAHGLARARARRPPRRTPARARRQPRQAPAACRGARGAAPWSLQASRANIGGGYGGICQTRAKIRDCARLTVWSILPYVSNKQAPRAGEQLALSAAGCAAARRRRFDARGGVAQVWCGYACRDPAAARMQRPRRSAVYTHTGTCILCLGAAAARCPGAAEAERGARAVAVGPRPEEQAPRRRPGAAKKCTQARGAGAATPPSQGGRAAAAPRGAPEGGAVLGGAQGPTNPGTQGRAGRGRGQRGKSMHAAAQHAPMRAAIGEGVQGAGHACSCGAAHRLWRHAIRVSPTWGQGTPPTPPGAGRQCGRGAGGKQRGRGRRGVEEGRATEGLRR